MSIAAKLLAALLGLVFTFAIGMRMGIKLEAGKRDAADLAIERAAAEYRNEDLRRVNKAATGLEAARRSIASRQPEVAHDIRNALSAPICPAGAASAALADLRVPTAVLDGLRRAGADPAPADRAASAGQ